MNRELVVGSHAIRRDGEMWCLTDMWKAGGAPKDRKAYEWLRGADAQRFVEFLQDSSESGNSRLTKTRKIGGGGGETWAHWQLAMAYAKWLNPEFHARVNDVYRAYTSGQLVPRDDEAIRLALRLERMAHSDYESAWDVEVKLELGRLKKVKGWTPGEGSEPQQMAHAYGRTWRIVLGDAVYEELKRRNPHPRGGSLHGQWLRDERIRLMKREDMVLTLFIARRSTRWSDYEREMRTHFRRSPIQLRLVK